MWYKFPDGQWSIESYKPAASLSDDFTGKYRLKVSGVPGNPTHYKAITVNCDDLEFVERLVAFLNEKKEVNSEGDNQNGQY